jgi:hypothetical protein
MVSIKSDPVLIVVGIILIIAVMAGIGASFTIPSEPSQKIVTYTSTGKAVSESSCCKEQGLIQAGCGAKQNGKSECCKEQRSLSEGSTSIKNNECQKTCKSGQSGCSRNGPVTWRN